MFVFYFPGNILTNNYIYQHNQNIFLGLFLPSKILFDHIIISREIISQNTITLYYSINRHIQVKAYGETQRISVAEGKIKQKERK